MWGWVWKVSLEMSREKSTEKRGCLRVRCNKGHGKEWNIESKKTVNVRMNDGEQKTMENEMKI